MCGVISAPNSQDAVCDVCGKTVRICGNTTDLVKDFRLIHSTADIILSPVANACEPQGAPQFQSKQNVA